MYIYKVNEGMVLPSPLRTFSLFCKMTQQQQAEEVFKVRGFEPRPFSIRNIIGDSINPIKRWVVAIGTSGGKTFTTAGKFEFLFKYGHLKSTDRVLIFAADKTILRDNFIEQFGFFFKDVPASFSWREVKNSKELKQAIEDGVNVIIMLPQTVTPRALQLLQSVKWSWFVLDEAHRWYFKNHITKILNLIKPTYQFLLTGTPFKFNLRKDKFIIDYTTVREMYEMGYLSDVTAQVLHSSVELNQLDYVSILGNVKAAKHFDEGEISEVLIEVLQQMVKKLKLPLKGYKSVHNVSKNALAVFGKLQKTIIFTHGTAEANVVHSYLNKLGVKSLISHSKIEGENANETFELFKNDSEVKILVAVNRGKEGFDFPELYNVIDMTYSQNFEVVMQIFGRVLRKNKDIPMKYFFKIAPKNTSGYFVEWMNAMFMLFDMEWYSKYNGKNGLDIRIPNALIKGNQKNKSAKGNGAGKSTKGKIKPRNVEFFNSLSFMKENGYFKLDDTLSTVASTTLRDVVSLFFNIDYSNLKKGYTKEFLISEAKKYNSISSLRKNNQSVWRAIRRFHIEDDAYAHMKRLWSVKSQDDFYNFIKDNNIKSRGDLWKNGGQWFKIVKKFNIDLDLLFPKKINDDWTVDNIKKAAQRYDNLSKFYKELPVAYLNAKKLGILEDISNHMELPTRNKPYNDNDIDMLVNKIKNAKSRNEARSLITRSAYDFLTQKKVIDNMFPKK